MIKYTDAKMQKGEHVKLREWENMKIGRFKIMDNPPCGVSSWPSEFSFVHQNFPPLEHNTHNAQLRNITKYAPKHKHTDIRLFSV